MLARGSGTGPPARRGRWWPCGRERVADHRRDRGLHLSGQHRLRRPGRLRAGGRRCVQHGLRQQCGAAPAAPRPCLRDAGRIVGLDRDRPAHLPGTDGRHLRRGPRAPRPVRRRPGGSDRAVQLGLRLVRTRLHQLERVVGVHGDGLRLRRRQPVVRPRARPQHGAPPQPRGGRLHDALRLRARQTSERHRRRGLLADGDVVQRLLDEPVHAPAAVVQPRCRRAGLGLRRPRSPRQRPRDRRAGRDGRRRSPRSTRRPSRSRFRWKARRQRPSRSRTPPRTRT